MAKPAKYLVTIYKTIKDKEKTIYSYLETNSQIGIGFANKRCNLANQEKCWKSIKYFTYLEIHVYATRFSANLVIYVHGN